MRFSDEALAALVRAIGIDAPEIARRKAFLEFGDGDARRLKVLHSRLQSAERSFVGGFYAHLLEFDDTRRFIPDAESLQRLKRTQAAYFERLTAGDYGPAYVADRLRVGVAHQRIGLEPKWYIGAYGKYLVGLLPELWRLLRRDPREFLDTYAALHKIVLFDMGLAIDTYIHADRRAILGLKKYAEDILASLPAGIAVLDRSFGILSVNRPFRDLFGLKNGDDAVGRNIETLVPLPGLRERLQGVLASGIALHGIEAALGEKRLRLALCGIRVAEEEEEEEEDRLLVAIEDITEEQQLRTHVRDHERRFHDLIQGLDAIVWEAEVQGQELRFTFVSDRAETLLGYPVRRWLGHELWPAVVHPDDRDAVFDFYNRVLDCGGASPRERFEIEYRARRADGAIVWLHDTVHSTPAADGRARLRGITADVTARKEMESRLAHQASHDALTGLPNRNLLADRLGQAMISAARHSRAAGTLFLDLDRFKTINDSLGHGAGDLLLRAVAERLRGCVREGDTVARLGGDEFVVILGDMARAQDAALVAQKILDGFVPSFRIAIPETGVEQEFFCTASIGISLYPSDGEDVQTLLKNADTAMYRAKERGGNGYQFFTREMDRRARRRLDLEGALRQALENGEFMLHYQPQIDLATREPVGFEALLRWNPPDREPIVPTEFIPLLEETGLIIPAGEWVLREACAQAKAWRAAGMPARRMAVNLSVRQLRDERLADRIARVLSDTGMEPGGLELEITESAVMQHVEANLDTLSRLRALGIRIALDDFGTGYSSLSHLKRLPLDTVKIDRSFVRDIPADENDAAIARTIIVLAHTLGLDVVAEGVETEEQLEFLRTHGCGTAQGFLFSHPVPAEELVAAFQRRYLGPKSRN